MAASSSTPKETLDRVPVPKERGLRRPDIDDVQIEKLLAQLVALHKPELSEEYAELLELILERTSLNLDGVLQKYSGSVKSKALGLVFNVVEKSSIHSLLLQNNAIDSETLGWALAASGGLGGQHKLLGLKTLHLSNNRLGTRPSSAGAIVAGASGVDTLASALGKGWLPALQELRLSSNDVECSGFQALATAFKMGNVSSLRILDLGNNGMSRSTASVAHHALADAMKVGSLSALEELRLPGCGLDSDCCKAYAAAIRSGHLSALKAVDFSRNWIGNDGAQSLGEAMTFKRLNKSMREIDFSGNKIGSYLATIRFPVLHVLRLRGTGLDRGTLALPKSLEILDLSSNSLGDATVSYFVKSLLRGNCRQLKELHLQNTRLGAGGLRKLGEAFENDYFRSLEVLSLKVYNLPFNIFEDSGVNHFVKSLLWGNCSQLKELHLEGAGMEAQGFRTLGEAFGKAYFRSLEVLNLSYNYLIGDRDMDHFVACLRRGKCLQLKELHLQSTGMGAEGLQELGEAFKRDYFRSLEVLNLSTNYCIGDTAVSHFVESLLQGNCRQLKELHLQNTGIGAEGLRKLGEAFEKDYFRSLEVLNLSLNSLGETAVSHFVECLLRCNCSQLKELHLQRTRMGAEGLRQLGEAFEKDYFWSLQVLNLSLSDSREDLGVSHFVESLLRGNCRQLKELHLQGTGMGAEGLRQLGEAFETDYFRSLEVLNLSSTFLGNTGVSDFVESLLRGNCCRLKEMHLQSTGMGAHGLRKLGEAFRNIEKDHFQSLEVLNLSFNYFGDTAVSHFGKSLRGGYLTRLKELHLLHTGMGDEGLKEIAEASEWGYLLSLEVLDLSYNSSIGNKGVLALAASLQSGGSNHLKELLLIHTTVGDEGLVGIARAAALGDLKSLEVYLLGTHCTRECTRISSMDKNYQLTYKDYRLTFDSTKEGPSEGRSKSGLGGFRGEKSPDKRHVPRDNAVYPYSKVMRQQEQDFDCPVDPVQVQNFPELSIAADTVRGNINILDLPEQDFPELPIAGENVRGNINILDLTEQDMLIEDSGFDDIFSRLRGF